MSGPIIFIVVSVLSRIALAFHIHKAISSSSAKLSRTILQDSKDEVVEQSRFLNYRIAKRIQSQNDLPVFVYSEKVLRSQAENALNFPNPYGLTVRFAMKACPNAAILQLFKSMGINFDASSGYEVERAIRSGVPPSWISLSSQELPSNFESLYKQGIEFNACSLFQLESFGKLFPGGKCGVRFNPGKGSGGTGKTVSSGL